MQFALIRRHPRYPGESMQTTADWYTVQSKEAGFDLRVKSDCYVNGRQIWPSASDREEENPVPPFTHVSARMES